MELKQREKTLIVVTVPLVLMAGWVLLSAWWAPLQTLRQQRDDLNTEVERNQRRVKAALKAQDRLQEWNRRSLPANLETAKTEYHGWLFRLATEVGFEDPSVNVASGAAGRNKAGAYRTLRYTVQAEATLEELTEFLFRFRDADYLHRIRNATINPPQGSKTLDLSFVIEALSLPDAQSVAVDVSEGAFDAPASFSDDLQRELVYTGKEGKIARAAALQLSGFRGIAEFDFPAGKSLEEVKTEINEKTAATGVTASLDGDTLYLRCEAPDSEEPASPQLDEYREAIVQRNVFAPYEAPRREAGPGPEPPPPPKFDPSQFAYVTGIVRGFDGRPKAFVIARTTGEKFELGEGDSFEVGDVHATMVHINRRDAEIEFDGKRWLVPLGDNLRQARPLFDESEEDQESQQDEPATEEAEQPETESKESAEDEPEQMESAEEEPEQTESAEEQSEPKESAEDEPEQMESAEDEPEQTESAEEAAAEPSEQQEPTQEEANQDEPEPEA